MVRKWACMGALLAAMSHSVAAHAQPVASAKMDLTDVTERSDKTYLFVGAHYRGLVLPQFFVNVFTDAGATFYSHTVGIELDIRHSHFSIIPAIDYTDLGTDDTLFLDKGDPASDAGNWAVVNSSLKSVFVSVDLLWSVPLAKTVDFEIGGGAGVGLVFGDLHINWVSEDPAAGPPVAGSTRFYKCVAEGPSNCNRSDHRNAAVAKVGNYVEPNWFNGGSVPSVLPWLVLPEVGIRFKPLKTFETRVDLGFALGGFFFMVRGAFGLEPWLK